MIISDNGSFARDSLVARVTSANGAEVIYSSVSVPYSPCCLKPHHHFVSVCVVSNAFFRAKMSFIYFFILFCLQLWDLFRPLEMDCTVEFLPASHPSALATLWHSAAHVLGESVEFYYKNVRKTF